MVLVSIKNLFFPSKPLFGVRRYSAVDLESLSSSSASASRYSNDDGHSPETIYFLDKIETGVPPLAPDSPVYAASSSRGSIDPRVISDATIGLSDGLTVPFALTAGLSALGSSRIVIFGGLAELIAGAISMGLGGWLAARGEAEAYASTLHSTQHLVRRSPSTAISLARDILQPYISLDVPSESSGLKITSDEALLTAFLIRFYHNLPEPSSTRGAWISAGTIAAGYFIGGFIPLLPYFFIGKVGRAFWWSVGLMLFALFAFGWGKTWITISATWHESFHVEGNIGQKDAIWKCIGGGTQMVILGGIAAVAATGLVKAFDNAGAR
ncbi:DUF125-domain-containing protein [Glonium stellatum]|uniref:DUF125-domain-containing protein n=1 Tax=Glonium stellatum TaxID=574774 RepID=A0A8E2ER37_9PEZI|nr:DUF125-domain-containing protein [Glonium stellatum]